MRAAFIAFRLGLLTGLLGLVPTTICPAPVAAGQPAAAGDGRTPEQMEADCWFQFMDQSGSDIDCAFPAVMEKADRESVRKLTRQVFQDAHCLVSVRLARHLIEEAMHTPDAVFKSPPQPVSCEVVTSQGTLPVEFTFAPVIELKAGEAVKATPGMADVKGVNEWLAWPVVAYVNASNSIESVMLRVVNAYLKRFGGQPETATP